MERKLRTPTLLPDPAARLRLEGELGRRLAAVTENWVLPAPVANPGILEMFRDRDRRPARQLVPWAGEFAGKYLTHAVQILRLTRDARLKKHLAAFVRELVLLQDCDGYLGPWPADAHVTNRVVYPDGRPESTWDTWGHYHVMLGLLLWHEDTDDVAALACAMRIGDLLCAKYLGEKSPRLAETGSTEMNLAPVHSLCLLYRWTADARYLELARQIAEEEFSAKDAQGKCLAGNYLEASLAGQPFHRQPKPRWESLHPIQGLAELYHITDSARYREAFEFLWWSMLEGDRHNNGGFTSGEQAQGTPYHWGPIETCCTVAWMAMSTAMLHLTGNPIVADELELSLFNSGLGLISPSGRWVTYDTPMDGKRFASAHSIVFQSRESTPELNCCSVNGPRVLGLTGEWALLRQGRAVVIHYYGPGSMQTHVSRGNKLTLTQETDYPREPQVKIVVDLKRAAAFPLRLRIPHWSRDTRVTLNGSPVAAVAGSYLEIERSWQSGDTIGIEFDFRLRYWAQRPDFAPYADWEADWRVFGPVRCEGPNWQQADESLLAALTGSSAPLPTGIPGPDGDELAAKNVFSRQGLLNFDVLCGRRQPLCAAYYVTEFDSPRAGFLPVIFAADWWSWLYVNGERVFLGDSCAFDGDTSLRLHRLELPVREGRNRIGGKTVYPHFHSRLWRLTIGRAAAVVPSAAGESGQAQLTSIYRGPLLLTFDSRFNSMDAESIPVLDAAGLDFRRVEEEGAFVNPWLLLAGKAADGREVRLCDFASAGAAGTAYRSWLPVRGVAPQEFSRANPSRT
jgi:hypothetical protein